MTNAETLIIRALPSCVLGVTLQEKQRRMKGQEQLADRQPEDVPDSVLGITLIIATNHEKHTIVETSIGSNYDLIEQLLANENAGKGIIVATTTVLPINHKILNTHRHSISYCFRN